MQKLIFKDAGQLVPAIIQDDLTQSVLMLGYMNEEAYSLTLQTGNITFYSRSKQRIWVKGESSGNFLKLKEIKLDCDGDALLIAALPEGPVCHTGTDTCWGAGNAGSYGFLSLLEQTIADRKINRLEGSYVSFLLDKGINKVAQKVGEEAVELIIAAKDDNDDLFLNEAADLLFHMLVLLHARDKSLDDVVAVLYQRSGPAG